TAHAQQFFLPTQKGISIAVNGCEEIFLLKQDEAEQRELKGGACHSYRLTFTANQYFRLTVEPRELDIVLLVFDPAGNKLAEIDNPPETGVPEQVLLITESAGDYRIDVVSQDKGEKVGSYRIAIDESRIAVRQDIDRIKARQIYFEAERLRLQDRPVLIREAIRKFQESLEYWRNAGERAAEATTLARLGALCQQMNELQKSIDYYQQALKIRRELGDHRQEPETLLDIGIAYSLLGNRAEALKYYQQTIELARTHGNHKVEATVFNQLGLLSSQSGNMRQALDYYNQALRIQQANGYLDGKVTTLINAAIVYLNQGELENAIKYYQIALAIAREIGDKKSEPYVLTGLGAVYRSLGELERSIDYYQQSITLLRTLGNIRGEAATLNNMAMSYYELNNMERALEYLKQALPLRRASQDLYGEAYTLKNIGLVYRALGQPHMALDHFQQSLALTHKAEDRRGEAYTLDSIGQTYYSLGNMEKALKYFQQALPLRVEVMDRSGEAITLYNIARVEGRIGRLAEARNKMERALNLIELIRSSVVRQELRQSYFSIVRNNYQFYIDLLMQQHKQQPAAGYDEVAFNASERARARSLLELLVEARTNIREGIDPTLVERESNLQRQLNDKAEQLIRAKSAARNNSVEALQKQFLLLTEEYEQLRAEIRNASPRYAALTQPQPLSLKEVQQQVLDGDTLLLEYSLGEERSYLWAVTIDSVKSYQLPKRTEIESAAQRVYELLTVRTKRYSTVEERRARLAKAEAEYSQAATILAQIILGPVMEQLSKKRLLVVSDGALHYIPFAALPLPTRSAEARFVPLILAYEVVNLPSASMLAILRRESQQHRPADRTIAMFADPVFSINDPRVKLAAIKYKKEPETVNVVLTSRQFEDTGLIRALRDSGWDNDVQTDLPRLIYSKEEAAAVTGLVSANQYKLALGFDANRATAMSKELAKYRFVHFATHGLLDSTHPELSGIVLSLIDDQGHPQNGFLRLHDIYNLKLSAELVVLSACQTGLGKEVKGEGLVGLTRGFMYAGAMSVMAGLWKVEDEATAELMRLFYEKMLKENQRPTTALRNAQLAMWRQRRWQSPFYWAAFLLQGDWR
ncbi:MAG: CHAT domain-containing tetratricopeptide repeat protein, partial [Acidobacteriota bacterium]